jgi:hypothetical protein
MYCCVQKNEKHLVSGGATLHATLERFSLKGWSFLDPPKQLASGHGCGPHLPLDHPISCAAISTHWKALGLGRQYSVEGGDKRRLDSRCEGRSGGEKSEKGGGGLLLVFSEEEKADVRSFQQSIPTDYWSIVQIHKVCQYPPSATLLVGRRRYHRQRTYHSRFLRSSVKNEDQVMSKCWIHHVESRSNSLGYGPLPTRTHADLKLQSKQHLRMQIRSVCGVRSDERESFGTPTSAVCWNQ